jgi:DNA-binding response OmpR family regulator
MTRFCPSCGFNFERDETIERDGFTLDPRGAVSFLGKAIAFTKAEAGFLHTIAASNGRLVTREVIGARIGQGEDPKDVATVMLHRVRKRLRAVSAPCPIVHVQGRGLRWEALA